MAELALSSISSPSGSNREVAVFVLFDLFHLGHTRGLMSCSYTLILSDDGSRAQWFACVCIPQMETL